MSLYHIYTDGACSGNPGPGGWGVVILDEQEQLLLELSGFEAATTNNRMEVQAAIAGISKVLELSNCPQIVLYSDSNYLVQTYTKGWMESWLRTNWKKGTVKNQDMWQELNVLLKQVKIRWVKVKGHSDNTYNNRCDQLAVNAIKQKAPGVPIYEESLDTLAQTPDEISIEQVVKPPFDPLVLNNPLSEKPSENRCLVGMKELEQNIAKIKHIAGRYSYVDMKNTLAPEVMQSITSWVGTATFNHPTIKVHPFFLQVGDLADFWLGSNMHNYSSPDRTELIKLMCTFIVHIGLLKAREIGLEQQK
jgi:ribonuclease HI